MGSLTARPKRRKLRAERIVMRERRLSMAGQSQFTVTICAALLVALTGCSSAIKTMVLQHPKARKLFTPPKPERTLTGKGWTNSIGDGTNTITVLHVLGDNYYSLGYHHGKLLGPEVKTTIESVERGAQKFIPKEAFKLL